MYYLNWHIGDIMALIVRTVWKINIVGTIQANQTNVPMVAKMKLNPMKEERIYKNMAEPLITYNHCVLLFDQIMVLLKYY